jgi:hypothetical protein
MEAVKFCGMALIYASKDCKNDRILATYAIENNIEAI